MVFSGLSTAWRLASWPTRRSPVLVNPTTDGVKRLPSLLMITVGVPPSITATTEFVVPRSMPTAFAIPHLTLCILRIAHLVTWHTSRSWRGLRSAHSPFLLTQQKSYHSCRRSLGDSPPVGLRYIWGCVWTRCGFHTASCSHCGKPLW